MINALFPCTGNSARAILAECLLARDGAVAPAVGLHITAAYWFTSSISFANPAVTLGRAFTPTFSDILPAHAPAFIAAQIVGALLAVSVFAWLLGRETPAD